MSKGAIPWPHWRLGGVGDDTSSYLKNALGLRDLDGRNGRRVLDLQQPWDSAWGVV
jgi:hypothetical protein